MKTAITILLLLVSAASPLMADSKDDLVKRVFAAMNFKAIHEQSMESIYRRAALVPKNAAEDEKIAYEKAKRRMNSLYREKLSWSALEPSCAKIYRERFTETELQALADFYESPVGKSIAAKEGEVSRLCSAITVEEIQKIVPLYQDYLTEELTSVHKKRLEQTGLRAD